MVPVGMGKDEMIRKMSLIHQLISQPPDAGAGIDNDDVIVFGSDFQAGGIAAVFDNTSP